MEHRSVVKLLLVHPHERLGKPLAHGRDQRFPHGSQVSDERPPLPARAMLCHADSLRRSLSRNKTRLQRAGHILGRSRHLSHGLVVRFDGCYAVVVQADDFLGSSTVLVARTTPTSARPATFRPTIDLLGAETRVLVEQTTVVDPQLPGRSSGRIDGAEIQAVDDALRLLLGL